MEKSNMTNTPEIGQTTKAKLYKLLEQARIIPNEQTIERIEAYRFVDGTEICEIGNIFFVSSRSGRESWSLSISPDGSSARGYGLNSLK